MPDMNNNIPSVQPIPQPVTPVQPVTPATMDQQVRRVQPVMPAPAPQPIMPPPPVQQPVTPAQAPVQTAPIQQPVMPAPAPYQAAPIQQPVMPPPPPMQQPMMQNYNMAPSTGKKSGSIVLSVINVIMASLSMIALVTVKVIYICKARMNTYEMQGTVIKRNIEMHNSDYSTYKDTYLEFVKDYGHLQDLGVHYDFIQNILSVALIIAAVWLILAAVGLMLKRRKAA